MNTPHVLRWVGAEAFVAAPVRSAPTLLRFDGDDFMDRLLALLAHAPQRLPELVAQPERWRAIAPPTPEALTPAQAAAPRPTRGLRRLAALRDFRRTTRPAATPAAPWPGTPPTSAAPALKLFQPVHQRYYLAAAHLVCEQPGLPPRTTGSGDRSGVVMRRLLRGPDRAAPPVEHAFVRTATEPGRWVPVDGDRCAPDAEEWLPVFPLHYTPPTGPARPLLAALVPVARRDEYQFAGRSPAASDTSAADTTPTWSRVDELQAQAQQRIIAPWQGLLDTARQAGGAQPPLPSAPWDAHPERHQTVRAATMRQANDGLVEGSWRLLQDIGEWLAEALPDIHARLGGGTTGRPDADALLALLERTTWPVATRTALEPDWLPAAQALAWAPNLRDALHRIHLHAGWRTALDAAERPFPTAGIAWPTFKFPLAVASDHAAAAGPMSPWFPEKGQTPDPDTLLPLLHAAIVEADKSGSVGTATAQPAAAARLAHDLAAALAADDGPARYVLRFVHRRCDCGPLHPPVVSAPSEAFELAGFFDSDAPLRPIRIALPFDTTPGGLRQYGKNSAFVVSDVLCGQMQRVRSLGLGDLVMSVLPWPFHKDLDVSDGAPCSNDPSSRFGMICSLSIPIITIVAFVLLIVIATLLDLVFRWMPFLMTCLPVKGLKGKR